MIYLKKSLGQHFLCDQFISLQIASLLEAEENDCLLEIGPGAGALTTYLEQLPHTYLLLLEKDHYWAQERQKARSTKTDVVLTDALTFNWCNLAQEQNWKIIGNLPYNVASPLIWDIVASCTGMKRAVFMVQKEVGQRICASVGNKTYGALSIWVQNYVVPKQEMLIKPEAFKPRPKVDSMVISFVSLSPEQHPQNPEVLKKLLSICFQHRRKKIGNILRHTQITDYTNLLATLHLSEHLRPEDITPREFAQLASLSVKFFPHLHDVPKVVGIKE